MTRPLSAEPIRQVHTASEIPSIIPLYDACIRQADEELVGVVLDKLNHLGIRDRTYVVIVSDHGEEFFEHGVFGHGSGLFRELVHVPWILSGPNIPSQTIERQVSLLEVAPTLSDLLGLFRKEEMIIGNAKGQEGGGLLLDLDNHTYKAQAWVTPEWKFVHHQGRQTKQSTVSQLFDLREDRGELHDLGPENPQQAQQMRTKIEEWTERLQQLQEDWGGSLKGEEIGGDLQDQLERLGYTIGK